jgi:hypothetical protein
VLKQSALDELDLPVKTVFGRLGMAIIERPVNETEIVFVQENWF